MLCKKEIERKNATDFLVNMGFIDLNLDDDSEETEGDLIF